MKLVTEATLATRLKPEYAERHIALTPDEIAILEQAITICEKAQELESEINRLAGDSDERYESDYAWAEIYLTSILRE